MTSPLLQFPLTPAFADGFDDDAIDTRWSLVGDGTAVEAGGVLTLAAAAMQQKLAQLSGRANRFLFQAAVDPTLGLPAADLTAAGITLIGDAGDTKQIHWLIARTPVGYFLKAFVGAAGEVFSEAHDGSAETLVVRRSSATTVSFGLLSGAGEFVEKHKITNWDEAAADAGLIAVSIAAAATASAEFNNAVYTCDAYHVDDADHFVCGQHLAATVTLYGEGFTATATAIWYGPQGTETGSVTINDDGTAATIVAPVQALTGDATIRFAGFALAPPVEITGLRVTGDGYRLLRALLPAGRWTPDPTNLINVLLAAIGRQLDILNDARRALIEREIFPHRAERLIHRWERVFGIAPNPQDSLAVRQARLDARRRVEPRIGVDYLNRLVDAVLAGVTITENEDHNTFGNAAFQIQTYEPATGTLDRQTYGDLLALLQAAGPAWVAPAIGAQGFVVSSSPVERDFLL